MTTNREGVGYNDRREQASCFCSGCGQPMLVDDDGICPFCGKVQRRDKFPPERREKGTT